MNIKEKAEAYDAAIKVIKDNLDALNEITETGANVVNIQSIRNCFYKAFPKLKESDDERIRKKLLSAFKGIMIDADEDELWYGLPYNDIIVWLEKQGNQREQLINKACDVLVDYIESYMFSRKQGWNKESKKKTLEYIRKELEE